MAQITASLAPYCLNAIVFEKAGPRYVCYRNPPSRKPPVRFPPHVGHSANAHTSRGRQEGMAKRGADTPELQTPPMSDVSGTATSGTGVGITTGAG